MQRMAGVVLLLAAGGAFGQQLPSFDVEKHCQDAGSGRDYCVERTQGIYNELKEQWDSIPPPIKAKCLSMLKTSPRPKSYYWLQVCLRHETMPSPPEFRY